MAYECAERALFERSAAVFAASEGVLPGRFVARQYRGLRVLEVTDPELAFLSTVTGVRTSTVAAAADVAAGAIGSRPPSVLVRADDDELGRGLARGGFVRDGTRAIAVKTLTPDTANKRPDLGGVSVRETGPGEEPQFLEVLLDGYQATATVSRYLAVEHRLPEIRRFVAGLDGADVAAAAMSVHHEVAVLGGSATSPRQRNRGAQSALLHRRLHEATQLGCDLAVATVTPSTASARNLVRAGFEVLLRSVWRLDPAGAA